GRSDAIGHRRCHGAGHQHTARGALRHPFGRPCQTALHSARVAVSRRRARSPPRRSTCHDSENREAVTHSRSLHLFDLGQSPESRTPPHPASPPARQDPALHPFLQRPINTLSGSAAQAGHSDSPVTRYARTPSMNTNATIGPTIRITGEVIASEPL